MEGVNEWRTISTIVEEFTNNIIDKIYQSLDNGKYEQGVDEHNVVFRQDIFTLNMSVYDKIPYYIGVRFTLFYPEVPNLVNRQQWGVTHYDNNLIDVILEWSNGIDKEAVGIIQHEVNHYYQFLCGFKKTPDFNNLYKKVVDATKGNNPTHIRSIALALYYSFSHEQDSLIQNFYQYLKGKDMREIVSSFNKAKEGFNRWRDYRSAMENTNKSLSIWPDNTTFLGLSKKQIKNMTHSGFKRFEFKLRQCYSRVVSQQENYNVPLMSDTSINENLRMEWGPMTTKTMWIYEDIDKIFEINNL